MPRYRRTDGHHPQTGPSCDSGVHLDSIAGGNCSRVKDTWCTREQHSTESDPHYLDKIFQKIVNITSSTVKIPQRGSTAVIHKVPVSILRSPAPVGWKNTTEPGDHVPTYSGSADEELHFVHSLHQSEIWQQILHSFGLQQFVAVSAIARDYQSSPLAGILQPVLRLAAGWTVRESHVGGWVNFRTRPDRSWDPPSPLYKG